MTNDYNINEAYFGQLRKENIPSKVVKESKKDEQLDEALGIKDIMSYINKLDWNSNPTLDPDDKKMAQRKAGELMKHIDEAETCMEEIEAIIGSALSPGFNTLVTKIVKYVI